MEEVNEFIAEKLKQACKSADLKTLAQIGDGIEVAIDKLIEAGNQGKLLYTEFQGKKLYSFYSADTLYEQVFGMTKSEFLAKKTKENQESEKNQQNGKLLCERAKKEKLPKWERVIRENFPRDVAEKKIEGIKDSLDLGLVNQIDHWDEMITLLEAGETKTNSELKEVYLGMRNNAEERINLFSSLSGSFSGDKFEPLITADLKEKYQNEPEVMEQRISELKRTIQEAMRKKAEQSGSAPGQPGE